MSVPVEAMGTAIRELLEGEIGTTRTIDVGDFGSGVFEGQPDGAQRARARHTYAHRFDVRVTSIRNHPASPAGAIGNQRIALVDIEIPLTTSTKSTVQEGARAELLGQVASDADDAIQALHFAANLSTTEAGTATNIVGGLLHGPGGNGAPEWTLELEDWDRNLLRSRIEASAVITISQAVS